MAAVLKQRLGMSLLKIARADFCAWNLRCDSKYRQSAAVTVEQSIDQMKIARPAAPRTNRKLSRHVRIGARSKGCHFFVSYVDPFDGLLAADCIDYAVKRVTDDSVNPFHSGLDQSLHQDFCNGSHDSCRFVSLKGPMQEKMMEKTPRRSC